MNMLRQSVSLPRWAVALLWVSMMVNVFLISAIATHWYAPRAAPREAAVDRPMARLIARLPREDARIAREVQRGHRTLLAMARADYDDALAAAGRVVAREPLDRAAMAQALEEVRLKRHALTDARVQLYAKLLPSLSAEGRRLITLPE
jgi:uncharacterized membrane protein